MSLSFDALRPLVEGLPSIAMLSSMDGPGAGAAAVRLQTGLAAAGADVTIYVMNKTSISRTVLEIDKGPKLWRTYALLSGIALRHYPKRPPYFELFSVNKSPVDLASITGLNKAGIVHLNWIVGMVAFPQAATFLRGKRVVWTLMDMNPLSGGCHCTAGCEKYADGGCAACPQLGERSGGADVASQNFSARRKAYAEMDMAVVANSSWLTACAKRSILLRAFSQTTISAPYIDSYIFFPQPRAWARIAFGISHRRKVILFGASGIGRRNKGLHILRQALEVLLPQWEEEVPLLFVFGGDVQGALPKGYECISPGRLNPSELAKAYSAADIFVSPSFQDNLPNTVNEALSCGTPVVCFDRFSSEDVVINGVTGFTVEHPGLPLTAEGILTHEPAYSVPGEAVTALADAIRLALTMPPDEYESMRERCAIKAREVFSPVLQTARYLRLYRSLLGLRHIDVDGVPQ